MTKSTKNEYNPEDSLPGEDPPDDVNEFDTVIWKPKLTVSSIGCNPGEAKVSGRVCVATFVGMADGIKTVTSPDYPDQEFIALTGTFHATNRQSGEQYRSGVLYLPTGFQDKIINDLSAALSKDNKESHFENVLTEFAIDLYAIKDGNKSGYSYEARSLLEPDKKQPINRLVALANQRREKVLQLTHKAG